MALHLPTPFLAPPRFDSLTSVFPPTLKTQFLLLLQWNNKNIFIVHTQNLCVFYILLKLNTSSFLRSINRCVLTGEINSFYTNVWSL